ncbi:MAG: Type 1 glutamine amidotransferase-like domain-containing protein [Acholeplasmataceae bacterium]
MTHILLSRGILGTPPVVDRVGSYLKATDRVVIVNLSFFLFHLPDEASYRAFYDRGSPYYDKIVASFAPYGIREDNIVWLDYYQDSNEVAKDKIRNADVLYFPGGAPDLFMERIIERDLKRDIEAHRGVMIGSSAGAMIQFHCYHITPDREYASFAYGEGLDRIRGFDIEVHYRRRKKQKKAMRRVHRDGVHDIYALPDEGVILYHQNLVMPYLGARQIYAKKGIIR